VTYYRAIAVPERDERDIEGRWIVAGCAAA